MKKAQVWVKGEKISPEQNIFGEAVSIILTDPEDCENILFTAGPYIVQRGGMVTHEKLVGWFSLGNTPLG